MAIRGAVRFKPDTYRTSLETTIAELEPEASPPSGTVVMVAQLVAYDDTVVTEANYRPGDPATERNITVLYEEPLSKELAAFDALSGQEATTEWTTALEAFRDRVLPAGPNLVKAIRSARIAPPIVIGG